MEIALTLQYQVVALSKLLEGVNVRFVVSKPESNHDVIINRSGELNDVDLSNWTAQPPILMLPLNVHPNSGRCSGAVSMPGVIDQEPFNGVVGTGLSGNASEPGTYTKESCGL